MTQYELLPTHSFVYGIVLCIIIFELFSYELLGLYMRTQIIYCAHRTIPKKTVHQQNHRYDFDSGRQWRGHFFERGTN